MSTEDDMWQDYDYHMNTGELPEYFEDWIYTDVIILILYLITF